jgi:hypothetical protein
MGNQSPKKINVYRLGELRCSSVARLSLRIKDIQSLLKKLYVTLSSYNSVLEVLNLIPSNATFKSSNHEGLPWMSECL